MNAKANAAIWPLKKLSTPMPNQVAPNETKPDQLQACSVKSTPIVESPRIMTALLRPYMHAREMNRKYAVEKDR
jgi:hypothetical protein